MGGREQDNFKAAIDGFDWLADVEGEGFECEEVCRDHDDNTSTEKACHEQCTVDSAATAAAAAFVAGTTKLGGGAGAEVEGMASEDPTREKHKAAERERRKSMRELLLSLHALLPHGHCVRKEQSAILDEVIGYIPLAASRLSTLRGNFYHLNATRVLGSIGAAPPSRRSTTDSSCRRNNSQARRYHPYSSACSSSSWTTYGRSSCDLIHSDDQSPLSPLQHEKQDYHIMADARHVAARGADSYSITSGGCLSAPVPSQRQLHIQLQQQQQDEVPNGSSTISYPTSGSSPSVSIRVRGDRVSVSVIDTREPYISSSSCSSHGLLMLSAVLDELEGHHLQLLRSTHCRDGTKLIHYSESKIAEEMEGTPTELKAKLQHLVHKLQRVRSTGNA